MSGAKAGADVDAGTSVRTGTLPLSVAEASLVALPDGRVILAGGRTGDERKATASGRTFVWSPGDGQLTDVTCASAVDVLELP